MEFFPKVVFVLFILGESISITETVVVTWGIMLVLMIIAFLVGRNFEKIPHGIQNVLEVLYEGIGNLIKVTMGEERPGFIPYIGTLTLYLTVANLIGLITFRPPTADLSTTLALALITFILTQIEGIRRKGFLDYLKGFFEPLAFMAPLNFLGALTNPFALAFRLFGNIVAGIVIMGLVYQAVPIVIPVPLHFYFEIFSGILQTFIFIMLTLTFIAMAAD
ncbi:MAG: F0F1 ATP synthase subunit A [Tepidanaerobacteraceae bacterium]|nr:F0F1 ATP synthase subunit A [Tepidanaerobacteraceae bacterium]